MTAITIEMPHWLESAEAEMADLSSDQERMSAVIGLARRNIDEQTGGPFSAAVFEVGGGLVAAGVNVVVPSRTAIAHAEATAVAVAGQRMGTFDLGDRSLPELELFASTEPCVMCLGVTVWAGVARLVCAARDADAREIGFDEGPKPADWEAELIARGIRVTRDVERAAAQAVLRSYPEAGGVIYNGGRGRNA